MITRNTFSKLLSLVVCVAAVSITACTHKQAHEEEKPRYIVTTPMRRDTDIVSEYVAQIRAIQHIEVRAQEKGYLTGIFVDEGQVVTSGHVMFQIMPLLYNARYKRADAEAEFTEIEFQNTKTLADGNIVSANELALAKAKKNQAFAARALADAHRSLTKIRAPFTGIMGLFHVRHGSLVAEGDLLTTLSDNRTVWVYFNVTESEYLNFKTSAPSNRQTKVKLRMANGELFAHDGEVETIEADFDNATGNIAFRAAFPNADGLLRHGETGKILMSVTVKDALLIPQQATFEVLDKKYVFVVDKDNVVKTREIKIANEIPHIYLIKEGLSVQDRILVDGIRKVRDGHQIGVNFREPSDVLSNINPRVP